MRGGSGAAWVMPSLKASSYPSNLTPLLGASCIRFTLWTVKDESHERFPGFQEITLADLRAWSKHDIVTSSLESRYVQYTEDKYTSDEIEAGDGDTSAAAAWGLQFSACNDQTRPRWTRLA